MTARRDFGRALRAYADSEKAKTYAGFFKTGPGEYGEGDQFLGISVPDTRRVVKRFAQLPLEDVGVLLKSAFHEDRFAALLMLVQQFQKGNHAAQKTIANFYVRNARRVNNWDLVDSSADKILGAYLADKPRKALYRFARSNNLWERRIAIIATFQFIRQGDFTDTLKIAEALLGDRHDLIHKAVGWMLREVGNRSRAVEERFLQKHYKKMPRTMLRYAIEKFPEAKRLRYLKGIVR